MNVIIYWKSGDYADVYNVDKVLAPDPTKETSSLRMIKRHQGEDVEIARFKDAEIRGWQIFLTADDVRQQR